MILTKKPPSSGASEVYINTGPMVAFQRAQRIDVLRDLPTRFIVTQIVVQELTTGSDPLSISDLGGFDIEVVEDIDPELTAALDRGEASVIQGALRRGSGWVSIDEKKARRVAFASGLHVRGTLGLLVDAKDAGLIDAVKPVVEEMIRHEVRFAPALVRKVLQGAGE